MLSKKIFFILIWLLLIVLSVITPMKELGSLLASKNQTLLILLFQRIIGLLAFTLLFIQIFLGAFMDKLINKLGHWVFNFHIFNGILLYSLVFLHPAFYMLFLYKLNGAINPFYVYSDLCVLCKGNFEHFYNFGRVALWLMTAGILVAVFRYSDTFLQKNWRKFHRLNYFAFFLVAVHAKVLGTDISITPFKWIYFFGIATAAFTLVVKYIFPILKGKK